MLHLLLALTIFVTFVQLSFQQKPYNFRPESRHIEINEGEDTGYIGFDEIANQTKFGYCYIISDTIKVDYPIYGKENETDTRKTYLKSAGFSHFGNMGSCAFSYDAVNDKFPLKWTLIVYDNATKTNYTEEVTAVIYYNMPLFVDTFAVLPASSIVNFLQSDTTKLEKCSLEVNGTKVELDLNAIIVYTGNIFDSRLSSLGSQKCGYKIMNLALSDPDELTLYATDENNKIYRNTAQLIIRNGVNLINRTLEFYLGAQASVICGKETDGSADFDQQFCHLFDPQGNLVSHQQLCNYDLDIVTVEDLGTWRCLVGYNGMMDALEFTTEVVEKKPEYTVTFSEDNDTLFIIGCKLNSFAISNAARYCKFTRPDGKLFKVVPGVATAYYSTLTVDLENGRCSLEIIKPLRAEDKGNWKCEAVQSESVISGGFIQVESNTSFPYSKKTAMNVRLGRPFVIDCMVSYPSDYCHIVAPNGTQFKPDDRLQIMSGLCSFTVGKAESTDNGTWHCSIAQTNGIPDEIITVEISIIELKVLYVNVEATENEEVELICNTNGIPLDYCRFMSPQGLSYSLRKENSITKKISYKGRGLEYGDCGISISSVQTTDSGQWSCYISSGRYDYKSKADITRKIELSISSPNPNLSMAEAVGISVGVLTVVIATGGFIFYKFYGRRFRGSTEGSVHYPGRNSDDSSSGESVILSVSHNMYNT